MRRIGAVVLAALCACGGGGDDGGTGTQVRMTFTRPTDDFFAAPFPSDDLRRADGTIAIAAFPNPEGAELVQAAIDLISRSAHGFATSGGVFFSLTAPIDPAGVPDLAHTITADAPMFVMGVDAGPDFQHRYPLEVFFNAEGGTYGAANLLSLVPLQGVPLRPHSHYAAVVRRSLKDAKGATLGVSASMAALIKGKAPTGMSDAALATYKSALAAVIAAGVPASDIAGLAVFTTDDPTAQLAAFRDDLLAKPRPVAGTWMAKESFPDYCVFATTIQMPDFQSGTPPFEKTGGEWLVDSAGKPILQRMNESNLVVTVPKRTMPTPGFPAVVMVRTGGGGERPLVDRGAQAVNGGPSITEGTGPAINFAHAGYAGISVYGPLGGLRNVTMQDEQFLVFNVFNPSALRDTIRESALELVLMAHIAEDLRVPDCAGTGTVKFDTGHLALMGHSTGAWISGLVLGMEPRYKQAILSGFGGSFLENVLYKLKPLNVPSALRVLLDESTLAAGDPVLSLIQWGTEAADPQVYMRRVREPAAGENPRSILMEQGIVDHYILPRIANSTSLALGLDLAGTPLDADVGVPEQVPLPMLLTFSGGKQIPFPVQGNQMVGGMPVTAIVVQHPADGIEDGHEIVFQTEPPKQEYRCFLESGLTGTPRVPMGTTADAPCQ